MYIWILLATIMVALSFFNLSPRHDKENAVNEIRAAAAVNRFRVEHNAMVRTLECEANLKRNYNGRADSSSSGPFTVSKSNILCNLPYTSFKENLPIGYQESGTHPQHMIYCLQDYIGQVDKKRAAEGNSYSPYLTCSTTSRQYAVSFMPVPERWLSKTADKNGKIAPVATFSRFLAQNSNSSTFLGWTDCEGSKNNVSCKLRGSAARLEVSTTDTKQEREIISYTALAEESIFWQSDEFYNTCVKDKKPCMFMFEKFVDRDSGKHCTKLLELTEPSVPCSTTDKN